MEDMSEEEVIRQAWAALQPHSLRDVLKQAGIRPDFIVDSSDLLIPLSTRYKDEPELDSEATAEAA